MISSITYPSVTIISNTATLDFPSTNSQESSDLTIPLTGASLGDSIVLGVPNSSVSAGCMYFAWVSSVNTVSVRFINNTASPVNPTSGLFKATIIK